MALAPNLIACSSRRLWVPELRLNCIPLRHSYMEVRGEAGCSSVSPLVTVLIMPTYGLRALRQIWTGEVIAREAFENREYIIDIDYLVRRSRGQVRMEVRHRRMRRVARWRVAAGRGSRILKRRDGREGIVDARRTVRRCPDFTVKEADAVAEPLDTRFGLSVEQGVRRQ